MKLLARLASMAAVVTLAAVASAGPANAVTATLSFVYSGCTNSYGTHFDYTMNVHGETYWQAPRRIELRLWGDDHWDDDLLVGPFSHWYDWYGGYYSMDFCVNRRTLNGDWDGRDELYAGIRVYDLATGAQKELVEPHRLYGNF